MRILAAVMALFAVIYFLPAVIGQSKSINGSSREMVYKSAMKAKKYLNSDDRVIFDTSLGLLDQIKSKEGESAFLKTVAGKDTKEVVALARKEVEAKIAAGDPQFAKYKSWQDMMRQLTNVTVPE